MEHPSDDRRRKRRRLFASIGIVASVALIAFELAQPAEAAGAERWFWIVVGALLLLLCLAELLGWNAPDG